MSQALIPEFAETKLWVVRSTLKERYGHDIELQFADTEVQLGTGTDADDEIGDAVIGVPQVEADPIRKTKIKTDDSRDGGGRAASGTAAGGTSPTTTDAPLNKSNLSPLFWGD